MPRPPNRPTGETQVPDARSRETLVPDPLMGAEGLDLDDGWASTPETDPGPADAPAPPEADAPPLPAWAVRPDPMAAAEAALARAREARGVPAEVAPVEPRAPDASPVRDPFAAAEAALARAREARGLPSSDGALVRSTDRALKLARAEAELRRLKRERDDED